MGVVLLLVMGISMLLGIGSLVCWIMTLIKMFQDEEKGGVGSGIVGVICGLWAFIWGWQNHARHEGHKKIMMIWTGCFLGSIALNVIMNVVAVGMSQ